MKSFRFRLQTVKTLREHAEQAARERLAASIRDWASCKEALGLAETAERSLMAALQAEREGRFQPTLHAAASGAVLTAEAKVAAGRDALTTAQQTMTSARRHWEYQRRQLEALLRLEDRYKRRHRETMAAIEQKQLDEFGGISRLAHIRTS
jgi:flagellar export protein FliJ